MYRPPSESYNCWQTIALRVTGGGGVRPGVTVCDRGRGVKIGQKKRYVIVERPQKHNKSKMLPNSFDFYFSVIQFHFFYILNIIFN